MRFDVLMAVDVKFNIVMCKLVHATKMTGSSSDDCIY
jgi:hypothetical protein